MVLSVQLLLPSAILILAHARSVQIAVHHSDDECTATAHTRSVQVDVHCTATVPLKRFLQHAGIQKGYIT